MRLAEPTDCLRLAYMEAVLFPDNCFNELTLQKELKVGRCWIVERRGLVVAYLLARVEGNLLDIMRIGVMLAFQGRGIGTQLIEMAMTQAPKIVLCVRKNNEGALRLYHRLGFQIVGVIEEPKDAPSWVLQATAGGKRSDAHSGIRGSSSR